MFPLKRPRSKLRRRKENQPSVILITRTERSRLSHALIESGTDILKFC